MEEQFTEKTAAGLAEFYDLDLHLHLLQQDGQIQRDLTAAHEKDPPHLGGVAAQKAEELIQAGGTADEVEIIPCLGDKGAVGDDDLAVPVYGAEQEGELFDLAGQVLKRIAHQKVFLHQAEAHQLHPAPTEGLDIGGGGEAQQPGDLHSGGILRIDDHVDAQVPLQLRQARGVLLVPDPGDGVAGAHFFGCEAADHVDLIGAGGSDQQIGVLCPSFPKDGGRDTISLDGHHIQRVRGTAQGGLMGVHDGDAVVLTGELVGQAEAHFSIANDDDIQNAAHPGKDLRQKAKEYEAQPYPGPSKEKCALDRTGAGEGAF